MSKDGLRFPVFIVGSPRSGTSILVDALLSAGYSGFREGNFLSLIEGFSHVVERQYGFADIGNKTVLISNIDKAELKNGLFAVLKRLTEEHQRQGPWFDKTGNPEMILAVPVLQVLWPDAVFIFAKRRAIENIASRLKKFSNHSFEYHCRDWAKNMTAWRRVRTGLSPHSFIEVDQQEIVRTPLDVAHRLTRLLKLDPQKEADVSRTFIKNRPQQTDAQSTSRVMSLESTGWSQVQKDTFLKHCSDELLEFGYSTDSGYWADQSAGQASNSA